jgi:hypothetical protein
MANQFDRYSSRVIAARVTHPQAQQIQSYARSLGVPVGALLRTLASQAATPEQSPADKMASIAAILGLPDSSAPADVISAVQELADSIGADPSAPPDSDPSAAPATASGYGKGPTTSQLSRAEILACAERGLAPAEYLSFRNGHSARAPVAPPEPAPITLSREIRAELKRRGMTEPEFAEAKAKAVTNVSQKRK